jgi:hypothetical protein
MFPVRYELNSYINLLRNSVFKGLSNSAYYTQFCVNLNDVTGITEIFGY